MLWINLYFHMEDNLWVSEEASCEELVWSQKWRVWVCFKVKHHGPI